MKRIGAGFGLIVLSLLALSPGPHATAAERDWYDVQISYRINAPRNQRVMQYYEMMRALKKAGFVRELEDVPEDTEPEDVRHMRLRGTVAVRRVHEILDVRHVHTILVTPHNTKPPEDATKSVRVELELFGGLNPDGQRRLSEQTFEVLAGLQFRGAVGYDTHGYTRLIGSMPFNRVEVLLTDLREQPAGQKMEAPFRNVWAVRLTKVLPDVPPPVPRPRPPQVPKGQEKLTPDLRDVLAGAAAAAKPTRLEVILAATPGPGDRSFIALLGRTAPGLLVEGRLGPLVSVIARPDQAPALAALPAVTGVRLPRLPQAPREAEAGDNTRWQPLLDASGAARLHALGRKGRGTQLAVVDSDFRGWEAQVGKGLPAATRLIDLTRERNPDMQPDPSPAGAGPGSGTRHALTIARIAPEVSLILIRIDPAAPYMLQTAARAINGEPIGSINLDRRRDELDREQNLIDKRRDALLEERRLVFQDFRQEGEGLKRRQEYLDKKKAFEQDEARFFATRGRYLQYQRDLLSLRGIRVVASALAWHDGFPVDGTSTLSRYFDDHPFRAALWFQASGDTRGQSWAGLFRDADNNGVMEFAAPGQPLPAGAWSPELNFLSWQAPKGRPVADIPAGTRLRFTLQWREAHDPLYAQTGEDPYLQPLARNLRILLLRQLDPTGTRQPFDDVEVVAQSVGAPLRLDAAPAYATYEVTLEVQIKTAGRYAVRIEGRAPESIYPPGDATLPFMRRHGELRVRLFVAPLGAATGRAIFHDFATAVGSLGMPADARTAVTVGAADGRNRRQPYSAAGAPFNVDLMAKPDVLAYDGDEGTAGAAAFAAGLAALNASTGQTPAACLQAFHVPPGGVLRLPDEPSTPWTPQPTPIVRRSRIQ